MHFSKLLQIYKFNYYVSHKAVSLGCSAWKQIRKVSRQEMWDEQKHSFTLIIQFPRTLTGIKWLKFKLHEKSLSLSLY